MLTSDLSLNDEPTGLSDKMLAHAWDCQQTFLLHG